MARGTVIGEDIVSQASNDAYREGADRIWGERKPARREREYFRPGHPKANERGFVYASDLGESTADSSRCGTTVMVDRWREGDKAPDGTDIGTRAKRNAWMKATGNAPYEDFKGARERRAKEQEAKARGEFKPDPKLRETIGRELYKQKVIL